MYGQFDQSNFFLVLQKFCWICTSTRLSWYLQFTMLNLTLPWCNSLLYIEHVFELFWRNAIVTKSSYFASTDLLTRIIKYCRILRVYNFKRNINLNASIFQFQNYDFCFYIATDERDEMICYILSLFLH